MSDQQLPILIFAVIWIVERNLMAVIEATRRFFERNAVLVAIDFSFQPIPCEFHATRPAAPGGALTVARVIA